MKNPFQQRKKDILSKVDKSSKGDWDKKIKKLCDKINLSDEYLTTSSCSGRIMIIKDANKKAPGLFEFVSHDKVSLRELMSKIPKKGDFKFKQEPPILHVACKDMASCKRLLKKVQSSGWKRSGIISIAKTAVLEIIGTDKIEFPLVKNGKLLVDEAFLKVVLDKSNENLEKSWDKIGKLEKSL
jgi:tRNA wybutosine-synthesizing protein 3